ncbi:histidine triad nucleotide-binding protein 1-like [Condylostylus longicornis]|uniref:histidine triad nucleotide-binding protein 1-like n=1 Tax=Condylostylus longicornis TaxID=2530218 RepID=UPI00244DE4F0|nr:histidine triad nucleotide-binding protein 1-like [Condylostylus longicornis]
MLKLINFTRKFSKTIIKLSEEEKAKSAFVASALKNTTIFDKIISKEISADIIYEDSKCLAFNDINAQAKVHFLVIPKCRIPRLEDMTEKDCEVVGHIMKIASKLGKERSPEGFRLVVNNGVHGCQSIYHLHLHIIGGQQLSWPPGV